MLENEYKLDVFELPNREEEALTLALSLRESHVN